MNLLYKLMQIYNYNEWFIHLKKDLILNILKKHLKKNKLK